MFEILKKIKKNLFYQRETGPFYWMTSFWICLIILCSTMKVFQLKMRRSTPSGLECIWFETVNDEERMPERIYFPW